MAMAKWQNGNGDGDRDGDGNNGNGNGSNIIHTVGCCACWLPFAEHSG